MAKKGKLTRSASSKIQYKAYDSRGMFERNKISKLERVVKNQPNNEQAKEALTRILKKGAVYTRNRRSAGHTCKGLYKELGFVNNSPSVSMSKSKLDIRRFFGGEFKFGPSLPNPKKKCYARKNT